MTGHSRTLSVEARDGKIDTFKAAQPVGVGIRTLQSGGMGFSYSSSFDETDLLRMVDSACTGAQLQTPDQFNLLPAASIYQEMPALFDKNLGAVSVAAKVELALELERLTMAADSRIKRVRKASYGESVYSVHLRNSFDLYGGYAGSSVSSSVAAIAENEGDSQLGWDFGFSAGFEAIDIAAIASSAAKMAVSQLGAKKIAGMNCPVVIDSRVAADFLGLLAPSFSAENLFKGKSLLQGKSGEQLFPLSITIRDDATLRGGMATAPFDGEGVASQDTLLVEAGVINGFLYDTAYAARMGVVSTGNSARSGVKGLPHLGSSNFFIENGTASPLSLRADIVRGLLITSVIGMHTANPVSGDFSVGASGFLIEQGEITFPVKGLAISGNIINLFKNVEKVGDDLRFFSTVAAPSLRINSLDVSGD
ncbi:MAG: TldD/PmbA family protein [Deltaproteobacteria bacterium HGW-Deltaproteobacteria-23]|nr:MAG: TldD/PmbA family protein [Deltaproteobacteria bacterium HGW-Deltaproteobacteria-23]